MLASVLCIYVHVNACWVKKDQISLIDENSNEKQSHSPHHKQMWMKDHHSVLSPEVSSLDKPGNSPALWSPWMGYHSWDWWHSNSTETWEGAGITAQHWRSSQVALLLLGLWSCDLKSLKRLGRDELPSGCTLRSQPPHCFGNVGANNALRHGAELQLSPEQIVLFKSYFFPNW